ncbi:hypothetical protein LTR53_017685, partial [Teratosphaeriaceae sp. CCFEE 6253]
MAPVFASPDIAALVTAFPPPLPTRDRPSLVRSLSGNHLLDSRHVLQRFRRLLETSPSRITTADLPRRLGISGDVGWLLASFVGTLSHSRDKHSFLPETEIQRIREDLLSRSRDEVIDAAAHATSADISEQTLRHLSARHQDTNIRWWQDGTPTREYVYSDEFARKVTEFIRLRSTDSSEGVDLSQHFHAPAPLLLELAQVLDTGVGRTGEWKILNDRVVFVPARHDADLETRAQKAKEADLDHYVADLRTEGFSRFSVTPSGSTVDCDPEAVKRRYAELAPDDGETEELLEIVLENGSANASPILLVIQRSFSEAMETMRIAAPLETARMWYAREASGNTDKLKESILGSLSSNVNSELPRLLMLSSASSTILDTIISHKLEGLQAFDHGRFGALFTNHLTHPLLLYAAGLKAVQDDATLTQHLDDFLASHFRLEVLPILTIALHKDGLSLDRSRKRDYEKFHQASAAAHALSEISAAATKLARKQKLPAPDDEALRVFKAQNLQSRSKSMRKLPRASDMLQNLIWILLACSADGLYMSPGKDTTRMLKQYRLLGDGETASKLEAWRDSLKAGAEDQSMLREMRALAEEA